MIAAAAGTAVSVCRRLARFVAVAIGLALAPAFGGEEPALRIVDPRVPASATVGADVPLLMTIKNEATAADDLLRVSCPVANFTEKHAVDRGEGAPAMRAIKSIPIPAAGEMTFRTDAYHVMLLQTRQILAEGDTFICSMVFAKAGKMETEVHVVRPR